jgi:hypothetical protein
MNGHLSKLGWVLDTENVIERFSKNVALLMV